MWIVGWLVMLFSTVLQTQAQPNVGLLVFGECDSVQESQIVTYDLHTETRVQLTDGAGMKWFPTWSPDGSQIAYVNEAGGDRGMEIWMMNADGSDNHPLITGGLNIAPAWSPDGTHLAYAHAETPDQPLKLWLMRIADGANRALLPDTPADVDENVPRWSPDSRHIAFTSNRREGRYEIWVFDVQDATAPRPLTTAYHDDLLDAAIEQKVPAWSPDGTQIAYWQGVEMSDPRTDLPRDVWVMSADGGDPQRLTRGDDPNWSPDGSLVIYSIPPLRPDERPAIGAIQPDGSEARVLVAVDACRPLQSDWTTGVISP
jgi:TolB protein